MQESDLLEMLQEDDFISPTISTIEQYDLYVSCVDRLDKAQKDLEERQRLSNETSRLSRRIEKHHGEFERGKNAMAVISVCRVAFVLFCYFQWLV